MGRRRLAKPLVGFGLSGLGTFALSVGLARADLLPDLAGVEGWVLATVQGFILLLTGMLLVLFSFRGDTEPADVVPATVAFAQRMTHAVATAPARPAAAASSASVGAAAHPSAPAARAPAPPPRPRAMDPRQLALFRLDEEIRDLTRRINKAGVMLATGQLSDAGYARYVEDLKRQRGALEAKRVKLELGHAP